MTKMSTLILFWATLYGVSCQNKPKENSTISQTVDTLAHTSQTIRKDEPNCTPTDIQACAYFTATFIQVTSGGEYVMKAINEQIIDLLRGEEYTNVEAHANGFIEEYLKEKSELYPMGAWSKSYDQKVIRNDEELFVISTDFYTFTGGAHGYYSTVYENYDRVSGKLITLNDIFEPGYEKRLNEIGEEYLRRAMDIPTTQTLSDAGFIIDNNDFK
ncbi:MAG: DUF4163 domain-containing protein [Saprospiraceae bacterium]|nr:DUF4163 domain-containing protein [Saprospiraceae bacterium]